ncbi:DEKNAAC104944 [Brettanomyces naardenensis]|uniref:DEKNAAC104944 n=1 Tax=Brettanomyces naardenensis TaxID=13370 RepID=A0A448YSG8_BRENA|nr:DEKNAAC104944 [Brettanomyces naardenensis]
MARAVVSQPGVTTLDPQFPVTAPSKPRRLVFRPLTFDKKKSSASAQRISISGPLHVETTNEYILTTNSAVSANSARSFSNPTPTSSRPRRTTSLVIPPTFAQYSNTLPASVFNKLSNELRKSNSLVDVDQGLQLIVPTIALKCVEFLESRDPVEGIFRINGSIRKMRHIEAAIEKEGIANFNFDTFKLNDGDAPNCYDVAMVLKRWLANLENGLITPQTNAKLKRDRQSLQNSFDEAEENDHLDGDGDVTMADISTTTVVVHAESRTLDPAASENMQMSSSPISSTISTLEDTKNDLKSPKDPKDLLTRRLIELPIENLHLFLYLLGFLNRLTDDSIVKTTKMAASNLAKIFQLSFFKSDDLTRWNPIFTGTGNQSSESLLEGYKVNEELLCGWIDSYQQICANLKDTILDRKEDLEELLSRPVEADKVPPPAPSTAPASTISFDKASKRRSMFGYRSFSNMFSSSSFSLASSRNSSFNGVDEDEPVSADSRGIAKGHPNDLKVGQHKQSRSVSDPVALLTREPLEDHNITTLENTQNIQTVEHPPAKPKGVIKAPRRRPQSMFLERRFSSLFTAIHTDKENADANANENENHNENELVINRHSDSTTTADKKSMRKLFGWFQK